jgi:hypothetical protein
MLATEPPNPAFVEPVNKEGVEQNHNSGYLCFFNLAMYGRASMMLKLYLFDKDISNISSTAMCIELSMVYPLWLR